ncbi:MAG: DMT family transporter [Bdellovibrionota bacterium]
MSQRGLGIVQIVLSGICFGFLGIFGKSLFDKGVVPGELLSLRFSMAAILTFIYIAIRRPALFRVSRHTLLSTAALGIFGYALFSFCFFSALKGLSVSLTVLLLYTYPVLVALGGRIFFGERIQSEKLWAFPFALLGLLGLVWGDFSIERAEFLILGFIAALFYAIYILASSRLLRGVDPLISTPLIQTFAAITLGSMYLRDNARTLWIVEHNWFLLLLIAVVCSIAAMGLFQAGLQKLNGWEVSILSTTEPLTGVLLATFFLAERLTLVQMFSALLVVLALVWVSKPSRQPIKL